MDQTLALVLGIGLAVGLLTALFVAGARMVGAKYVLAVCAFTVLAVSVVCLIVFLIGYGITGEGLEW